jgi:hypothetical protein
MDSAYVLDSYALIAHLKMKKAEKKSENFSRLHKPERQNSIYL